MVTSSNKVNNNETSRGISQSLTPCLSHNMQRRAFIIFIKTIFLGFLLGDPVSTPNRVPAPGQPESAPSLSVAHSRRTLPGNVLPLVRAADPHQNILAEPQAIWKMIHLTSEELEFLYFCLEAVLAVLLQPDPVYMATTCTKILIPTEAISTRINDFQHCLLDIVPYDFKDTAVHYLTLFFTNKPSKHNHY